MSFLTTAADEGYKVTAHPVATPGSQLPRSENHSSIRSGNAHAALVPQKDPQGDLEGAKPADEYDNATLTDRLRSASKRFEESSMPLGMWDATATVASSMPSVTQVRRASFDSEGWSTEGQIEEKQRHDSAARRRSSQVGEEPSLQQNLSSDKSPAGGRRSGFEPYYDPHTEVRGEKGDFDPNPTLMPDATRENNYPISTASTSLSNTQLRTSPFDNGYHFPPKHSWTESTSIFLKAFWSYTTTWLGFLVVVYGLNVVAWGGMIFLLLCNAAPAMCTPDCDDINSPRRIWIEIDAQVLTALFSVTGFGLIPWRFRDLFYLLQYRFRKDQLALRRLAGIHRDWFRLEGSQNIPVLVGPDNVESEKSTLPNPEGNFPYPLKSISNAPLTGVRAHPTPIWKLDYVIWMFVWNTFLQAVLSGIMWGLNRYDRPSWATGLFVALACIVAACAGIMIFKEGKKVKGIEGIPVSEEDQERLKRDAELGIVHINNINHAVPKEKRRKRSKKMNETIGGGETTSAEAS